MRVLVQMEWDTLLTRLGDARGEATIHKALNDAATLHSACQSLRATAWRRKRTGMVSAQGWVCSPAVASRARKRDRTQRHSFAHSERKGDRSRIAPVLASDGRTVVR